MHTVKIFTSITCNDEDKKDINNFLIKKLMGDKFQVDYFVDEKLLGGIKILIDDKLYENTLSYRVSKLKEIIK